MNQDQREEICRRITAKIEHDALAFLDRVDWDHLSPQEVAQGIRAAIAYSRQKDISLPPDHVQIMQAVVDRLLEAIAEELEHGPS